MGDSDTGTGDWGEYQAASHSVTGGKGLHNEGAWWSMGLYVGAGEMAMGLQAPGHCGGVSQGASWYIPQPWYSNCRKGHLGVEEAEL